MKKFIKIVLISLSLILSLVSCNDSSSKNKKTETNSQNDKPKISTQSVLNANLATELDLLNLGLSSNIISKIIDRRPFLTMNDFDLLIELDNKEELYRKLFVPLNLNTTSEKNFKIIPGVGDRMAHEFDEYRPYTSIQQFKREIGKYVDKNEVLRYLNFVFVPVELNTSTEDDIKALPGVGKKMSHEFIEYRPYQNMEQFRKEIGKYVDEKELIRLERLVYLKK